MHSRGSHEERMPSTESGPSAELSTLCMMLRCTLQSVARWDACDDTPNCASATECEGVLGNNLMYPAPVCDFTSCIEQDQLSDVQVEILQRYTGAL